MFYDALKRQCTLFKFNEIGYTNCRTVYMYAVPRLLPLMKLDERTNMSEGTELTQRLDDI